ncbi:abhydrolase domain-containing protein [Ophiostoma piceae UAMH 11346]|uniref:Abhydrolase domain-containing protein n=1 Tax=Ophiostoma piceae (strain UAMH 11346) TaxID=1262450 RepID=S3CCI3_OPHP1|nr:abhydrolase domain-containing protein [Ophiostoma piceae UAMH 11346]
MATLGPLRMCRAARRGAPLFSARAAATTASFPAQRLAPGKMRAAHAFYSSSASDDKPVELVYDLHRPEKPIADDKTKPILFLHGLFGSKKNNRSISKMLARDLGRSIYALDLRNHGESPHAPKHDYVSLAGDVSHFIKEHGLKETTVIGHSMGAKTAMTLALSEPDLVADIVAVDNAPVDAAIGSDFAKYVRGMKQIDRTHITRQAEADKLLQPFESSLVVRQFLLGNMHRVKPDDSSSPVLKFRIPLDILARALDNMGDFPYKDPSAIRFNKPALFVRGTKSKYVADEALPIIGQFFPKFELVDIDAGHWVISESPEAFRQAVVRFLTPEEE